ncbi:unnamed protein product [Mortierella alpina]
MLVKKIGSVFGLVFGLVFELVFGSTCGSGRELLRTNLSSIEECWSKIKTLFRRSRVEPGETVESRVLEGAKTVTKEDIAGWIRHAITFFPRCMERELDSDGSKVGSNTSPKTSPNTDPIFFTSMPKKQPSFSLGPAQ